MNKIERAIYDTELHIKELERTRLIITTRLETFKEQLNTLVAINEDNSIPLALEAKPKHDTTGGGKRNPIGGGEA